MSEEKTEETPALPVANVRVDFLAGQDGHTMCLVVFEDKGIPQTIMARVSQMGTLCTHLREHLDKFVGRP